jgi:hypothetical protein
MRGRGAESGARAGRDRPPRPAPLERLARGRRLKTFPSSIGGIAPIDTNTRLAGTGQGERRGRSGRDGASREETVAARRRPPQAHRAVEQLRGVMVAGNSGQRRRAERRARGRRAPRHPGGGRHHCRDGQRGDRIPRRPRRVGWCPTHLPACRPRTAARRRCKRCGDRYGPGPVASPGRGGVRSTDGRVGRSLGIINGFVTRVPAVSSGSRSTTSARILLGRRDGCANERSRRARLHDGLRASHRPAGRPAEPAQRAHPRAVAG